ncbi:MAG: pyruvate:ferredoxin (flavodoxin) oxidoreductase [Acidobacteria bacterium RIFCSPLOWO2_12_FULL_67_14b]|nr:MAG: pyruvate:ferredoxin (flavodoxin) oxidoreductase [Acidobacteria bacterium RIFCSPLOWO2_12_FULL_67_14b]
MNRRWVTLDGNEAAARVAYQLSEVIAIYPITPSSQMGEAADEWAAQARPNLWGAVPAVVEMQSEGGAAGALHGAIQAGALGATFTSSQGLLLMIADMFRIAGELTPALIHVSARAVATHALSIFGDHSDVMAVRTTGWALLASGSVQEAQDLAAVAHAASLASRIPFVHFFDGFRTSHEVAKIEALGSGELRALVPEQTVASHRLRALSPERPVLRGSAQNPDVFFQSREAAEALHRACPDVVLAAMERLAQLTRRRYRLFDYYGAADADRVLVIMGSGAGAAEEAVDALNAAGEKVGLVKVRLFRPFSAAHFVRALPPAVKAIAVLDRTKEPGSAGEPLYQDVRTALDEELDAGCAPFATRPRVVGGRYGLGSKEFTPAMAKAVFDELERPAPKTRFTVGIDDDVSFSSLAVDASFSTEGPDTVRAILFGLGSDGTVGASKNTIKIIGDATALYAQGYFVYDSKKSGSTTASHLRFGPRPIRATYLVASAGFIGCHQWELLERADVLEAAAPGAIFLLNSPYGAAQVWERLPALIRRTIRERALRLFVIDADRVAGEAGMGRRVNTVLQTCFFALSGVLPRGQAIAAIKQAALKSYRAKGEAVVAQNYAAIDSALAHLQEVALPEKTLIPDEIAGPDWTGASEFVRKVLAPIIAGKGDRLPVSAMPLDGTFPVGTSKWEKRNLAAEIPVWDEDICIQCNKCALVCPHAAIRVKSFDAALEAGAPPSFKSTAYRGADYAGKLYSIQVAPEDCTGCELCLAVCARDKKTGKLALVMQPQRPLRQAERENFAFFLSLPQVERASVKRATAKGSQFLEPLFEFSGACSGCGQTPYLKLATQLFGERMLVANATGCSSIYGGNLPTTPWTCNAEGRGPAWANSLFEDNAEFGYGMRLALDKLAEQARDLAHRLRAIVGEGLVASILGAPQADEGELAAQRARVGALKHALESALARFPHSTEVPALKRLLAIAEHLVRKSVWMIGGDGWAYDIGYGGLDHVLAAGRNVNVLVLDTESYSNTGGQMSKATPRAAVARFAASGKKQAKKDLGLLAMTYGTAYVAQVAMGANDGQTVKALVEAESYDGASIVIAYAHCIAHGLEMSKGLEQQKKAVACGHWPLFRFDPRRAARGENPLQLDSKPPSIAFTDYAYAETRYRSLQLLDPKAARELAELAQQDVTLRWRLYERLAAAYAPQTPSA